VFEEGGVTGRLIAGEAMGLRAAVRTHSPLFYLHLELAPGARTSVPADYAERAIYVVRGGIEASGEQFGEGQMLVLTPGAAAEIEAIGPAVVMALGGEPIGPRFIDWNFVSFSKERIEQAKADWRAGRMKLPDLDDQDFIPLPPEPGTPANPMS
jgi:redox-sensitive bicupin YhaK (pirin superfamily)